MKVQFIKNVVDKCDSRIHVSSSSRGSRAYIALFEFIGLFIQLLQSQIETLRKFDTGAAAAAPVEDVHAEKEKKKRKREPADPNKPK